MHLLVLRYTLSAPSLALLDVAPMSLCNDDFIAEDDMDFIPRVQNSLGVRGACFILITDDMLVIHFEWYVPTLYPDLLSDQHTVVANAVVLNNVPTVGAPLGTRDL